MSRFLLLNFEDFGLNQDITKTIQPFNPFCICCLDREGPMFDLDNCEHSDYLDAFDKPQLKQFNQLVCIQCHNLLQKIKRFQMQILESYDLLLSGTFTDTTVNSKRLHSLIIQNVVDDLHLPPDIESIPNDNIIDENIATSVEDNFLGLENDSDRHENITCLLPTEENLIHEHNRLNIEENKNIKTALEILERNNQSFVTLGSQLQFLNGEHLSFLEPSLLSKEILTDIPLVPARNLSTDLDNGLINNPISLEIEIDGPDKMFYDSLDLSPVLMGKEANMSELIKIDMNPPTVHNEIEPKIITEVPKPKKERKVVQRISAPIQIKTVKLSQEELNRERVLLAQSNGYLKYKFRCETCIFGFNFTENLEDHTKRKHGPRVGDSVVCNICYQVIPTAGGVTEHNYRHYTRYECMVCGKRYKTHSDALRHSARKLCDNDNAASTANKTTLKLKLTQAQQRRAKLKRKQAKNAP